MLTVGNELLAYSQYQTFPGVFLDTDMRDFFARVFLRTQETSLSCFVLIGATGPT